MTKGPGRFEFYLIQLDDLLIKASRSENPALFLYQNDARTKLFMLEGLCRLYAGMHDKKRFNKLLIDFKTLEDLLGQVDYYDAFAKDFAADVEMPSTVRIFTEQKRDENLVKMNAVLLKRKWINHDPSRTKRIRKKLKKADWLSPEKETDAIKTFYICTINNIKEFHQKTASAFTDLESQVHSMRRKLRWLSIYPQALQGAIQLTDHNIEDDAVKKYLTADVVNSPFNKLPAQGNNEYVLLMEKNYFLALSYMIASLGKLKDKGLRVLAVKEAVEGTQFSDSEVSLHRAFELNNMKDEGLKDIMAQAHDLCNTYFDEGNLDKLLADTPAEEQQ